MPKKKRELGNLPALNDHDAFLALGGTRRKESMGPDWMARPLVTWYVEDVADAGGGGSC